MEKKQAFLPRSTRASGAMTASEKRRVRETAVHGGRRSNLFAERLV
jgi:hypothetical protein